MDFEYDGQLLSDFGLITCSFDSVDVENVSAGSQITFNTTSVYSGKDYLLTDTKYEECLSAEFDICKNLCYTSSGDFEYFTIDEERDLMRWLNRRTFQEFRLLAPGYEGIYFEGSFNVEAVKLGENILGFHLTLTTNRPFGLQDTVTNSFSLSSAGSYTIKDSSDEIGYTYPDVTITCLSSGTLTIQNSLDSHKVQITGCSQGEVITFKHPIITSSLTSHNIMDSFNFNFPRIINTSENRSNTFTFSIPCRGTISYKPIAKVGL